MVASPFALRPRVGETLPDTVERGSRIRAKRRECKQLEAKLRKETQFNRKVEINAQFRACQAALAELEADLRRRVHRVGLSGYSNRKP